MAKAVLTKYRIKSPKLNSKLKITFLSDLHERPWADLMPLIKENDPDVILIAGDMLERYDKDINYEFKEALPKKMNPLKWALFNIAYYYNFIGVRLFCFKSRPDTERTYNFFRELVKIAPVYMSLGNHEQKLLDEDLELFKSLNINLLDNSCKDFYFNGDKYIIGGLSSFADESFLEEFSKKDGYKILLSHHPIYYDVMIKDKDIDLILSGHNHGGQMRFSDRGLFSSGEGFFPKYDKGIFYNKLIVTAGCANTVAMPRINNPREIVSIELVEE